jgi:membrane-bound lytic murein transglycosylase A
MPNLKHLGIFCLVATALLITGCPPKEQPLPQQKMDKDYDRPLPPGRCALEKVDPSQYPNFGEGWTRAKGTDLKQAVQYSIHYLKKPSSKKYYPIGPVTHDQALASLELFLKVIDASDSRETMNSLIRDNFDVYRSVGCDDAGTVLFTGYYSPIFDGSRDRTDRFQQPLYKLPPGFQKTDEGEPVGGPWRTREEIDRGGLLAGNEIAWLGDKFETYVLTVQGSGFLKMPDGSLYEIGYAGNNGHPYTPIRKIMVADGVIDRYKGSLDAMIKYFKEHPDQLDQYMYQNKRYVFFQESKGGPFGCLNEPVTKYHSIATDKDIFPRGSLAFVDTYIPNMPGESWRPYRNFMLDQDRGAAIRAPGRCDIYMGVGEEAGKMAGNQLMEGKLYYLVAKPGASLGGAAPVPAASPAPTTAPPPEAAPPPPPQTP